MARAPRTDDTDTTSGNPQANIESQGDTPTAPGAEMFTIAGQQFSIPNRYSAGHVINEGEAARLNQDVRENVRNNFAAKVKDGGVSQADIDAYLQTYQFGVRQGGGGRTADPVEREARALAKQAVEASIRKRGQKPADYSKEQLNDAITAALERYPQLREQARSVVAARGNVAIDVFEEAA